MGGEATAEEFSALRSGWAVDNGPPEVGQSTDISMVDYEKLILQIITYLFTICYINFSLAI